MASKPIQGCFVDGETGLVIERELTSEEIALLQEAQSANNNERTLL